MDPLEIIATSSAEGLMKNAGRGSNKKSAHPSQKKHSELDETIIRLIQLGTHDQLHLRRLKKRKLQLKDQITALNSNLIPDDIA